MSDSLMHIVKTSAQWEDRSIKYLPIPRGCLCVELTASKKTKIKIGEGDKHYSLLPYVDGDCDLSQYYTKEEINNLLNNLNRMAIMSTEEYPEKEDLPLVNNKLGDVRFVKSSSPSLKLDPDIYLWNGHKWIFVGYDLVDIDLSQFIKREEFEPIVEKVNEMYPKMHTHENKDILDNIEEPYTTAEKDKLESLENYDDTEIRGLIRQATHVHPNKSILDQIEKPFKTADKEKLDSLENYDDTDLRNRVTAVESTVHTHSNKAELDSIYSGFVDEHEVLVEFKTIAENEIDSLQDDVADLKTKIHTHSNKNILDSTTAPYTREDKQTLTDLANITVFDGASATYDGFRGYVPAPRAGEQTYFLRGDGTWAKVKGGSGDKYKAGDGIYILSGEATSDTFPFNIYSRAATLKQYIIYGNVGGVGNLVDGHYQIPIIVSAPGHPNRTSTIIIDDPMYDGDYIDFEKQVFAHYRSDITSQVQNPSTDTIQQGISSTGNIYYKSSYQGWGGSPRLTDYFEIDPSASYEISPVHSDSDFSDSLNINVYDENQNRTRTIITSTTDATLFVPMSGEKYIRQSYVNGTGKISLLQSVETPCVLQNVVLYPNAINTINVGTTIKPSEIYVEVDEPIDPDPDDPMSEYTGIIYNDGVLDVTQEDPNTLNELTVHFRESSKVLTIPNSSYTLPIATDSTLGGIIVGDNLSIDENGVLSADAKSTRYISGDGIGITTDDTTYTKLEYLKSTGSQYIMTDIVPEATYRTVVDMKFDALLTNPSGGWVFGAHRYNVRVFYRSWGMTEMAFYAGYEWNERIDDSKTTIYNLSSLSYLYDRTTIILNRGASSFGSTTRTADVTISSQPTGGIVFFGQPESNSVTPYPTHSLRIYDVKIYDSTNELLHQLVPVKRNSDNILGFYDIVTDTFYPAGGSAYFETGNEMGPVEGGTETKIVSVNIGDGLQFNENDAIEVKLGNGLQFDANGAIESTGEIINYIAGDGINISRETIDPDYYFESQVTCSLTGSFSRSFTKTTSEPAFGALITGTPEGQSDHWTGPLFVGKTSTSVGRSQMVTTYSMEYLGETWYYGDFEYFVDGDLTDLNNNLVNLSGVYENTAVGRENAAKALIDVALAGGRDKVVSVVPATTQTLGGIIVGDNLTIDQNGVLSATGGETEYSAGQGIEFETDSETYLFAENLHMLSNTPINMGIIPSGSYDFHIEIQFKRVGSSGFLIICYNGYAGSFSYQPAAGRSWIYNGHESWIDLYGTAAPSNSICTVDLKWGRNMTMQILPNGTYYSKTTSYDPTNVCYVLLNSSGGNESYVYYVKMWDGDTLVGDFVPCVRQSDNATGFFNKVDNTFHTNTSGPAITHGTLTGESYEFISPTSINAKLGDGLSFDSDDAITVDEMVGADGTNDGTSGTVPVPTATDNTKFLRGDGTWSDPPTYTLPVATTSTLGGVKVGAGLSMNANDEIGVTSPYVTSVTNQGSLAGVITVAKSDGTSTDVDVLDNMRLILNCNYDSSLNQTQLGEPVNAPQAGMTESSPIIGDLTELEVT